LQQNSRKEGVGIEIAIIQRASLIERAQTTSAKAEFKADSWTLADCGQATKAAETGSIRVLRSAGARY
jgi:hypothetical protein